MLRCVSVVVRLSALFACCVCVCVPCLVCVCVSLHFSNVKCWAFCVCVCESLCVCVLSCLVGRLAGLLVSLAACCVVVVVVLSVSICAWLLFDGLW